MEEQILKEILNELKALHKNADVTNDKLDSVVSETEKTNKRLDGLYQSFVVLQDGIAGVRRDLQGIKEILAEKVIWHNDNVIIDTDEGKSFKGIIHREGRK